MKALRVVGPSVSGLVNLRLASQGRFLLAVVCWEGRSAERGGSMMACVMASHEHVEAQA